MSFQGILTFKGASCSGSSQAAFEVTKAPLKLAVESTICLNSTKTQSCTVNILSVDCKKGRRLLSLRQLNTSNLVVNYEILIQAICDTSDCSNAEAIGNALYKQVSDNIINTVKSGTLVDKLKASSSANASIFQSVTSTESQFKPVFIPILASFVWYPDWSGNSGKCLNDGTNYISNEHNLSVPSFSP